MSRVDIDAIYAGDFIWRVVLEIEGIEEPALVEV
jgi:hypothetical protein